MVRERLSTIRKALEAWNAAGGLPLELSFGLAGSDDGSVAPEVLLRQADARMMEEKNRVRAVSLPGPGGIAPFCRSLQLPRHVLSRPAAGCPPDGRAGLRRA